MINKVLAGVITVGFLHVVRPDATAARWGIALVSVLMFEGIRWSLDYIQMANRRRKQDRYILSHMINPADIVRWADEQIKIPFKEVS